MYTAFQKNNVHYDQNWGRPVHSLDHKIATEYGSFKTVGFLLFAIESIKCFQIICFKKTLNATRNN